MKLEVLDFFFPFLVFFYGIVGVFVLESKFFARLAQERLPVMGATLRSHRNLVWVCLFVGGFWSLQNLWFNTH